MTVKDLLIQTYPISEAGGRIGDPLVTEAIIKRGLHTTDLGIRIRTSDSERGSSDTSIEGSKELGLRFTSASNLSSLVLDDDGNLIFAEPGNGRFTLEFKTRDEHQLAHKITGINL